jgi:hypothetical protein
MEAPSIMRRTNTIKVFHRKAPKKLIQVYKESGGNCYKVAKKLNVNSAHVWNLLKNGIAPKREDLRIKLFVSRPKRTTEIPDYMKTWSHLPKEERRKVIQQYINWRKSNVQ